MAGIAIDANTVVLLFAIMVFNANLIVAELARKRGVKLGFFPYLKVGLPLTALGIALTLAWLLLLR